MELAWVKIVEEDLEYDQETDESVKKLFKDLNKTELYAEHFEELEEA